MDNVLVFLLEKGGNGKRVRMTTAEIGRALGMSQQNASRRLKLLEDEGLIGRKNGIMITSAGMKRIKEHYGRLKKAIEGRRMKFSGRIVDGFRKGKFYLSLPGYRKGIRNRLGFEPYAGTLNIKLSKKDSGIRSEILREEPVVINGFKTRKRTFGDLFAYHCRVNGRNAAIVFPLRSNHPQDIIEIIADVNLRKVLGRGSGSGVVVEV
jgi:riboflavin kinase